MIPCEKDSFCVSSVSIQVSECHHINPYNVKWSFTLNALHFHLNIDVILVPVK